MDRKKSSNEKRFSKDNRSYKKRSQSKDNYQKKNSGKFSGNRKSKTGEDEKYTSSNKRPYSKPNQDRFNKSSRYKKSEDDSSNKRPYSKPNQNRFNKSNRYKKSEDNSSNKRPYSKPNQDRFNKSSRYKKSEDNSSNKRPYSKPNQDRFNKSSRYKKSEDNSSNKRPYSKPNQDRFNKSSRYKKSEDDSSNKRPYSKSNQDRFKPKYHKGKFKSGQQNRRPKYDDLEKKLPRNVKKKYENTQKDTIRLNRFIAQSGVCSRREADDLIKQGKISVNDQVVTEMGLQVKRDDVVMYKNVRLYSEKHVYILLNKPKDYITTTEDPQNRKTVMDLITDAGEERVFPVGRLDRDTTGLLLFTNDGELTQKLSHPSNQIRKIYQVTLDKPLTQADFTQLTEGLSLEDGTATVDSAAILNDKRTQVGVELHIGRNRIVRRLFEHLGYQVEKLDRTVYAGLDKKELPRGNWRYLSQQEVIRIKFFN